MQHASGVIVAFDELSIAFLEDDSLQKVFNDDDNVGEVCRVERWVVIDHTACSEDCPLLLQLEHCRTATSPVKDSIHKIPVAIISGFRLVRNLVDICHQF